MLTFMTRIAQAAQRRWSRLRFRRDYPGVPIVNPSMGGASHSQDGQDRFLAALLRPLIVTSTRAVVVDVGCNEPERFSNSLLFEQEHGCDTIAIDPLPDLAPVWAERRPRARFINAAISREASGVTLFRPVGVGADSILASTVHDPSRRVAQFIGDTEPHLVPTRRLDDILAEHEVTEVLFMSIDVEGAELEVLATIDFERVRIQCFLIENNAYDVFGSDDIRQFLMNKGYVFVARIGHLDDVFLHHSVADRTPDPRVVR